MVAVDRDTAVRWGIRAVLESSGRFLVVGEAADGRSAARPLILGQGIVVMDARMASIGGFRVMQLVRAANPRSAILLLGDCAPSEEAEMVEQAIAAGASGYLRKACSTATLLGAALVVADGAMVFSRGAACHVLRSGTPPAASGGLVPPVAAVQPVPALAGAQAR